VPAALALVENAPPESKTGRQRGDQPGAEAGRCSRPLERLTVVAHDANSPGAHTDGLSACSFSVIFGGGGGG
jgi:hypothetical protein